ncbi:Glycosyltransferase [Vibrio crassostreae]|nr:Glycosyltransferase [Vibrio crassostreae]CAK3200152.1 Glycosyltransferase [Vibrio crassostreae]CAK3236673.1 Glycosyltransferase [Vibrio crassostreae]CAK3237532.1 Glycosyltransferase [Vibrio crassostreae]CAK3304532.1 Glycosyltransferase [Vibrio crassostreae]
MKDGINRFLFKYFETFTTIVKAYRLIKYFPRIKTPKTFNEKILHRKLNWRDRRYIELSDKVLAKDYVRKNSKQCNIIETLWQGKQVSKQEIQALLAVHDKIVLKTNHSSGDVFFLENNSSDSEIDDVISKLVHSLSIDFGVKNNEKWYSKIERKILIEKYLKSGDSRQINDYKFHVFNSDGSKKVVIQVDHDRHENHTRSWFDETCNHLIFTNVYPNIVTTLDESVDISRMINVAKELSSDFDYVRVDLYSVDNCIYFGELTFAHESGVGRFSDISYDYWMGNLWK